ncbi:MAG: hypothetical protein WCC17_13050 [Candidatus Nitrosopolaris sp.]
MNDCSNRPYLFTNLTGAIKNFTSLQEVNDCDSGYDDGWNKYCHRVWLDILMLLQLVQESPVQKQRQNHLNTSDTLPSCIEINLMNNPQPTSQ